MASKPTFVLVPGSFHPASAYDVLLTPLHAAGYPTQAISLPSALGDPAADVSADAAYLRDTVLRPLVESGKDIVLVAHSYAGLPAGLAVDGLSQRERAAKGLKGGVLGAVYVAALVPTDGTSLEDAIGGALPEWIEIDETKGLMRVPDPVPWFYSDLDADAAKAASSKLGLHSLRSFRERAKAPIALLGSEYNGRRGYIRTLNDQALPSVGQDAAVQSSGVDFVVRDIESGHSPFLNKPEQVTALLEEFASLFVTSV